MTGMRTFTMTFAVAAGRAFVWGFTDAKHRDVVNAVYLDVRPAVEEYLDASGDLRVRLDTFDREVAAALAEGVASFSVGLSFTGAGRFTPESFDGRVPVEGQSDRRRIRACPLNWQAPAEDGPGIRQSRTARAGAIAAPHAG